MADKKVVAVGTRIKGKDTYLADAKLKAKAAQQGRKK